TSRRATLLASTKYPRISARSGTWENTVAQSNNHPEKSKTMCCISSLLAIQTRPSNREIASAVLSSFQAERNAALQEASCCLSACFDGSVPFRRQQLHHRLSRVKPSHVERRRT